ncbi:MAG: MAPEG family protein [Spirulinaceae cyanobacterium]
MAISTSAILLYSIVGAVILIYLPFLVVGYARTQVGYDMQAPRAMLEKLPDYAKRANWAHQNSFETFMVFAAAAFMAYVTGVDSPLAIGAASAFLGARLLYSLFYIFNIPLARSLMFGIGSFCTTTLFVLSLLAINS